MIADAGPRFGVRKLTDRVGTWASIVAVAIAIVPLIGLIGFVIQRGGAELSWHFLTTPAPASPDGGLAGGISTPIVGTLIIVGLTCVMGIPLGILSGIYLATSRGGRFTQGVRFACDVIAGLPSILAGILVGAFLLTYDRNQPSALAASVALTLLMFPTVTRATDAALSAIPPELREAALGLGATDAKTVFKVLIPTAASGIVTAIILGIARVAGETAPLLFTLGFLGYPTMNLNPFHGVMPALPGEIYVEISSPFSKDKALALGAAFVLFFIVMFLNLLARAMTYRLSQRTRVV